MCQNCNENNQLPHNVFNVQFAESSNCGATINDCPSGLYSSKCTVYLGPNLPCTGVVTNDSMELALQKMDTAICANTGNYSTYSKHCLDAFFGSSITTEAEFVSAITNYTCTNKSLYDTFVGTTFPAYQAVVSAELLAITQPAITCAAAGVTNIDSLTTVLNKYCTAITNLVTATTQFEVNWGLCFAEPLNPPATIAQGFEFLQSQICQVKAALTPALPVFNNGTNCLVGGTTSDTLENTINMMITRLCQTPTFDINALTWGNLTKPSTTTTNLQDAFQTVLTDLSVVKGEIPTVWSADFIVTATDGMNPALGKTIALAVPLNQDRFVAATAGDTTPGTLQSKLYAGTNISFDYITHANQVTINAVTNVLTTDTYSVHFTGDGSTGSHISANVQISATAGNALSINTDGLFAAAAVVTPLTFVETDTIKPTETGSNVYHNVKIDTTQANNILVFSTNGLYVPSPVVLTTVVTGGTTSSAITSVTVPVSGTYAVVADVRISSATTNNALSIKTDGLAVQVSSVAGNIISIVADGLYAASSGVSLTTTGSSGAASLIGTTLNIPNYSINAYSGLTQSGGSIILGGALGANTTVDGGTTYTFTSKATLLSANHNAFGIIGLGILAVNGTETQQYAVAGIYGSFQVQNNGGTFTPYSLSKHGAVSGTVYKSGTGHFAGILSSVVGCTEFQDSGNITTVVAFRAMAPELTQTATYTGAITNAVGLYIDDINASTVAAEITNKYSIYQVGNTDINLLNGKLIMVNLPVYADNTAAAALPTGQFYRTSTGVVMVKY